MNSWFEYLQSFFTKFHVPWGNSGTAQPLSPVSPDAGALELLAASPDFASDVAPLAAFQDSALMQTVGWSATALKNVGQNMIGGVTAEAPHLAMGITANPAAAIQGLRGHLGPKLPQLIELPVEPGGFQVTSYDANLTLGLKGPNFNPSRGKILKAVGENLGGAADLLELGATNLELIANYGGDPGQFSQRFGQANLETVGGIVGGSWGAAAGTAAVLTVTGMTAVTGAAIFVPVAAGVLGGMLGQKAFSILGNATAVAAEFYGNLFFKHQAPPQALSQSAPAPQVAAPTVTPPVQAPTVQVPNVGGILLDRCADVHTDVGRIEAAWWDAESQELVLLGRDDATGETREEVLPSMDADHLRVALRAALACQPIGVSIDPPAQYRDAGTTPPDGTDMWVSYLGSTEGTLFGAILFEADRVLKILSKNVDNVTSEPLDVTVPGHLDLFGWMDATKERGAQSWHRFWFVIDNVSLRRDPASGALVFDPVAIRLLAETERNGGGPAAANSSADDRFADFVTLNYAAYARDFPILTRLEELAKVAAIAKFLVSQGVDLDVAGLFTSEPVEVTTPERTPGIRATRVQSVAHTGAGVRTRSISLYGGVDLDPSVTTVYEGAVAEWRSRGESARPEGADTWTFEHAGARRRATAISLAAPAQDAVPSCTDHSATPFDPFNPLAVRRIRDVSVHTGPFGAGWRLFVPYSITVLDDPGKRREVLTRRERTTEQGRRSLVLHDHNEGGAVRIYRRMSGNADGRAEFHRITGYAHDRSGAFSVDSADRIVLEGDTYRFMLWDGEGRFDAEGRLVRLRRGTQTDIRYEYVDAQLRRLISRDGPSYRFEYDGERLVRVRHGEGAWIDYSYRSDQLARVADENGPVQSYGHDSEGRLVEVRDANHAVVMRVVLDAAGRAIAEPPNAGAEHVVEDGQGTRGTFRDERDGRSTLVVDDDGETCRLGYDERGRLTEVDHDSGASWRFSFDAADRIRRLEWAPDEGLDLTWDDAGNLAGATGPNNEAWSVSMSPDGRLTRLKNDRGASFEWDYDDAGLKELRTPGTRTRWTRSGSSEHVRTDSAEGRLHEGWFDRDGLLTKFRYRNGPWIRVQRDSEGRFSGLSNEAGGIQFEINEDDVLDVLFPSKL